MTSSLMADPNGVLRLGSLELVGPSNTGSYRVSALGDDWTFGEAEAVTTIIDSLLGEGQLVSITRHSNRTAKIGIEISAKDGLALSQAEAALMVETEKANTLTWVPPDQFSPTTVFDVVTSWVEHTFSDEDELRLVRRYVLTLSLYPHPRSAQSTTVPALGSGIDPADPPTSIVLTDASSLAGFTGRPVIAGKIDAPAANGTGAYVYQRADNKYDLYVYYDTGAVQDWTATPYISVDWKAGSYDDLSRVLTCYISGPALAEVQISKVSEGPSPIDVLGTGWKRTIYAIPEAHRALVRKVKFYKGNDLTTDGRWTLQISEIGVTDGGAANDGTARELFRSLDVRGTARAMGAIDIRHENTLGDVLVWSGPAACSPPLRKVRTSGAGEIGDPTAVSGAYEDIGATPFVADMPLDALPAGAYLVMARLATTSGAGNYAVTVTAQTRIATSETTDVAVGQALTLSNVPVALSADPTRKIMTLGVMHLPATEVAPGSSGVLRVSLQGANVRLDEAWLFNITDGALTFVTAAEEVLRITSPTLEDPRRRVWTGPTDAALYDAGSKATMRDEHLFTPGDWAAFTVTTGAEDAAVTVTYDKRWHSNAGEDG